MPNSNGDTALHITSKLGHSDFCAFLLENRAHASPINRHRNTPLHVASEHN